MMIRYMGAGRTRTAKRSLGLALALTLPVAACDSALEVDEPSFATPPALSGEAGLPVLYAGAVGDFQIAYSGSGGDSYLSNSTNFSDEYHVSDTFTTRNATDQREQFPMSQGNTSDGAYSRLQYARRAAGEVAGIIAEISPQGTADSRYTHLKALEGFAIVALGEGFCGAVPVSEAANSAPGEPGVPLSTEQLFDLAVTKFDESLAGASNHLAAVGKGRALLNNGRFAEAAAAVSGVPTDFTFFIEHSSNSTRQNNPLFSLQDNGRYSMSDNEGINGLPYRSSQDPRLPWIHAGGGFDSDVPLYIDLRHPSRDADVLLASGIEARLIEAEADLQAGGTQWLTILNDLRADVYDLMSNIVENYEAVVPGPNNPNTTLPPLTDPGTDAARVDLLFQERAFWLFSTAHRHGDMRRLIRQYGRTQDQVFPTGAHHRGGTYGNDVTFPLHFQETQNPHFTADMCNVDQA